MLFSGSMKHNRDMRVIINELIDQYKKHKNSYISLNTKKEAVFPAEKRVMERGMYRALHDSTS